MGGVEKGVTGLCSCFASLLGDAVCWLGLQRERERELSRGERRRGEERGGRMAVEESQPSLTHLLAAAAAALTRKNSSQVM